MRVHASQRHKSSEMASDDFFFLSANSPDKSLEERMCRELRQHEHEWKRSREKKKKGKDVRFFNVLIKMKQNLVPFQSEDPSCL